MNKSLIIPRNKKVKGLTVFCKACRFNITGDKCHETGKKITSCPHPEKHVFKSYIYLPNSNVRKTRTFPTKNVNEAAQLAIKFEREIKEGIIDNSFQKHVLARTTTPLLLQKMSDYIIFLKGESGPDHTRRERTKKHVSDNERSFVLFGKAMQNHGFKMETLALDITQDHVGYFHSFLGNYGSSTYNRYMTNMGGLYRHIKKFEGLDIRNPFDSVQKKKTKTKINIIELEEFKALLNAISEEGGIQTLSTGEQKRHYFLFLKTAFKLALLCGLRREQLVTLKYSNIQENSEGQPYLITSKNLKVNRILNSDETGDERIIPTPVTPQLRKLLMDDLNYMENKDSDKFLIAPDSHLKRETIMNILSKSFTHYWKKLNSPKQVNFADLRKTFINKMQSVLGDNSRLVTGHQSNAVMDKHYLSREFFAKIASNNDIFPELDFENKDRMKEVQKIKSKQKQKNNSLER